VPGSGEKTANQKRINGARPWRELSQKVSRCGGGGGGATKKKKKKGGGGCETGKKICWASKENENHFKKKKRKNRTRNTLVSRTQVWKNLERREKKTRPVRTLYSSGMGRVQIEKGNPQEGNWVTDKGAEGKKQHGEEKKPPEKKEKKKKRQEVNRERGGGSYFGQI